MRLIPDAMNALPHPRLSDADPLPPADRAVEKPTLMLENLYQIHAPRLLRFFARKADRQDAQDLVQESFARLAAAGANARHAIEQPEAYLSSIASNMLRNRAKSALQRSLANTIPADEANLPGSDLVAALEARDLLNRVQAALMLLRPKTRDIFLAHRIDGQSYIEIATRTGLSVKGVEWHMSKAIAHLDRALRVR